MTVQQLITELKKYPETMDVFMAERKTEFTYGLLNSVKKQKIDMTEDPDGEILGADTVIVLDEE